ncbi:MAG: chloride channel protein, partial [Mailhella sp.]|nr:chloride channel protein [Mailhella sp.]
MHHKKGWWLWANRGLLTMEGLAIGTAAALVIGLFRLCLYTIAPALTRWFSGWQEDWWIMPLWLIAVITAARLLGWMVRRVPLISGSGIPQTELVITGRLHLSRHDWLRVLPAKFLSCLLSSLSGLSLGRTAPSIQMGAAAASLISGLWERFSFSGHIHIAAGAAAGLAATFGAPAAGLLFAFEELHLRFTRNGFLLIAASVLAAELTIRL